MSQQFGFVKRIQLWMGHDNLFSKGQTHTKKPDTVIRNFHPVILILNPPPNLHIMAEIRIFRVIPDHQQGIRCNAADDALMVDQG